MIDAVNDNTYLDDDVCIPLIGAALLDSTCLDKEDARNWKLPDITMQQQQQQKLQDETRKQQQQWYYLFSTTDGGSSYCDNKNCIH
jgi:hypothetical protein